MSWNKLFATNRIRTSFAGAITGFAVLIWILQDEPIPGYICLSLSTLSTFSHWSLWQQRKKEIEAEARLAEERLQLLPIGQFEKIQGKSACRGCKYYYGNYGIVCAIHPAGIEDEFCADKEI